MAERLTATFEVLTPLFMGEADPSKSALRPPSIKGLLRFWYRAVAPQAACSEACLFGGAGNYQGQAPFLLRAPITEHRPPWRWDARQIERFNQGRGKETRNGLKYLGYSFDPRFQKEREALGVGTQFVLTAVFPKAASEQQRRALLASMWLLGHLGGAGSRSRRGFGSLALREWDQGWDGASKTAWPELDVLQPLADVSDPPAWRQGFSDAKALFAEWFGGFTGAAPPHPHLGEKTRLYLGPRAGRGWQAALDSMGRSLQDFRVRKAPDYARVKDHLSGRRALERAPQRAAFGLPLAFRYSSLGPRRSVLFEPFDGEQNTTLERQSSLLHLRLVRLADGLHPLFVRLDGAVPGEPGSPVAPRGESRPLLPAEDNLLDSFMDHLKGSH